eukprot:EG_transcript_145
MDPFSVPPPFLPPHMHPHAHLFAAYPPPFPPHFQPPHPPWAAPYPPYPTGDYDAEADTALDHPEEEGPAPPISPEAEAGPLANGPTPATDRVDGLPAAPPLSAVHPPLPIALPAAPAAEAAEPNSDPAPGDRPPYGEEGEALHSPTGAASPYGPPPAPFFPPPPAPGHPSGLLPVIHHHEATIFSLRSELGVVAQQLGAAQAHIQLLQQREMAMAFQQPAHRTSHTALTPVLLPPLLPTPAVRSPAPSHPTLDRFTEYISRSAMEAGIQSGSLLVGKLSVAKYSDQLAHVANPAFMGEVQVVGLYHRNRALPGDLVVVRLLPQDQWAPLPGAAPARRRHTPRRTPVGAPLDAAATEAAKEAFGPDVDPLALYTPPDFDAAMVACGTVVAVLQARDKQELYCRLHPAKAALLDVTEDTDGEGVLPGPWKESPAATVEQLGAVVVSGRQRLVRLTPVDPEFPCVEVPAEALPNPVPGDALFLVQLCPEAWPAAAAFPQGTVLEARPGALAAEYAALIHEAGLQATAGDAAGQVEGPAPGTADWAKRADLRSTDLTIAISDVPAGVEGIDGCVSCRVITVGGQQAYRLGVHIPDVAHALARGTAADEEAAQRAVALQLPDCAVPLLPPAVLQACAVGSSGDTLAVSAVWTISAEGAVLNEWLGPSVVRPWGTLPAPAVSKLLKGTAGPEDVVLRVEEAAREQVFASVTESVRQMYTVASALRRHRLRLGQLTVRGRNVGFKFGGSADAKVPVKVVPDTEHDVEGLFLVEELALFTQRRVALKLQQHLPRHAVGAQRPAPADWKTAALCAAAKAKGVDVDGARPGALGWLVEAVEGSKSPTAVGIMAVVNHLLGPVQYSIAGGSHDAPDGPPATPCTCPTRRYLDIVVQRLLLHAINLENHRSEVPAAPATMLLAEDGEQRAAGYAPADLAQLCRQGTAAAAKAQRVQQAAEETCLALHLRALTKRDPWLTAVGYVVDVAPGALIVTVPAYGVTAEVAYTDRHQRWQEVRYVKETHSAVVTWEGGATLELALLTPLEVRLWPARSGRSLRPAVHLLVWDHLDETQKAKRRANPETARDFVLVGELQERQQDFEAALASYTLALEREKPPVEAFLKRGDLLAFHLRDSDAAMQDYDAAVAVDNKDPAPFLHRAKLLCNLRRYADAIADCMRAIWLAPTDVEGYLQRAAAFTSLGDADRATADYNTAIQLDPRAVPAFLQRGCLHAAKAGDYTAAVTAVADFTAVIELQPLHALAHRKRGELLYERFHDVPRAVRDLVQVAALEPKQLHPALYQSYQHMGFATEAQYHDQHLHADQLEERNALRRRVGEALAGVQGCQLFVAGPTLLGLGSAADPLALCCVPGYEAYADWWKSQGLGHTPHGYQAQYVARIAQALTERLGLAVEATVVGRCPTAVVKATEEAPIGLTVCLEYSTVRLSLLLERYLRPTWAKVVAFYVLQWARRQGDDAELFGTPATVLQLLAYFLLRKELVPFADPGHFPATQPVPADALFEACLHDELEHGQLMPTGEEGFRIGKVISDFFHFYTFEFDYASHVVALGTPALRCKKEKGWADPLCLEDPFAPDRNLTKGVSRQALTALRGCFAAAFDYVVEIYASTCGFDFYQAPAEDQAWPEATEDSPVDANEVQTAPKPMANGDASTEAEAEGHPPGHAPTANGFVNSSHAASLPVSPPLAPAPPPPLKKKAEPTAEEFEALQALVKAVPARCRVTLKALETTHWKAEQRRKFGPLAAFVARFPAALTTEGALVFRTPPPSS